MAAELRSSFNGRAPQRELALAAARAVVAEQAARHRGALVTEPVGLEAASGRVLARAAEADRDFPPFRRSMRDGYAVRAADGARPLRCLGQVRAGEVPAAEIASGTCVEIMTGAAVPEGADAVAMVERTRRDGGTVVVEGPLQAGENIAAVGSDSPKGSVVAAAGRRLGAAGIAALASVGCIEATVFARPRVAILASGDELVAPEAAPGPGQIRNSNLCMLAAQARRAGAEVVAERLLPDRVEALEAAWRDAQAQADIVLFAGGASVGAHDLVGGMLARRGAEFFFDAVRVRPGRPVLFGHCEGRLFFGLPGNPMGSLLAFELFARPALDCLGGCAEARAPFILAEMGFEHRSRPLPLTAFRPVRLMPEAQAIPYHGSADLAAAAAADGFLLIPEGVECIAAGTAAQVLLR